jgi:hypothetical protein
VAARATGAGGAQVEGGVAARHEGCAARAAVGERGRTRARAERARSARTRHADREERELVAGHLWGAS